MIHLPESSALDSRRIIVPFRKLTPVAQNIVGGIHAQLAEKQIFVPREDEQAMWDNHHVIIDESDPHHPLAGASAIHDSDDCSELTRVWRKADLQKNGVASAIIQYWLTTIQDRFIFALTTQPDAYKIFIKNDFMGMGTVSGLKKSPLRQYLPKRVQKYPEGRDPWMLARFSENKQCTPRVEDPLLK